MAQHKWSLKMANYSHLFLFFVIFLVPEVLAITNYIVGDTSGWTLGVDYSSWTIGKTFFVGDNLVFKYEKGKHNVLDVDVSSFSQCSTPKDKQPMITGNDVVPLTTPGIKWFICSIPRHCNSGQKFVISVEAPPPAAGQPPPTPPIPIQNPPTPSVDVPDPPPPSSLPPVFVPTVSPSPPPPGRNQTAPQFPIAPTPTQNIPPSESPVPSSTGAAPPPSGAAEKFAVSSHLGFLAMAIGVLAGIMI